jgi:hypothetical protein
METRVAGHASRRGAAARDLAFHAGRIARRRIRAVTGANVVIALTVLVFLVPAVADVMSDERRAYGYLAPDAFYYLTVGVNWVKFGFPTFDQQHPTNGFHPLWQWTITGLYRLLSELGYSRLALVPVAVLVGLVCLAASLVFFGRVLARNGRLSPLFVLLPVGAFSASISTWWWSTPAGGLPLFGTLWSFANGLESALAVLLYAWVAWLFVKRPLLTRARALLFGTALGLFTLARLDHGIFAVILLAALAIDSLAQRNAARLRLSAIAAMTFAAWLGAYLLYNKLTVDRFMPISGAVKSTFPTITNSNFETIAAFPTFNPRVKLYQLGRLGSLAITALGALISIPFAMRLEAPNGKYMLRVRDGGRARLNLFLLCTALGTIALVAYDILFVITWHIGQWYAPVSVIFLSLFVVEWGGHAATRWIARSAPPTGMIAALTLAAGTLVYFRRFQVVLPWGAMYADFCLEQAPRVVAHYGKSPPAFISDDDGVVAFGTGFPATSGTLLVIDTAGEGAWRGGRFKDLVLERGIDRIMILDPAYIDATAGHVGEKSEVLRMPAERVLHGPLTTQEVEVEYSDGSFAVLRLRHRETAGNGH